MQLDNLSILEPIFIIDLKSFAINYLLRLFSSQLCLLCFFNAQLLES